MPIKNKIADVILFSRNLFGVYVLIAFLLLIEVSVLAEVV